MAKEDNFDKRGQMPQMLYVVVFLAHVQRVLGTDCDVHPTDTSPQGVHLAYAGESHQTSMVLSFFTCGPGGTPVAHIYGTNFNGTFNGSTTSYLTRHHHNIMARCAVL